MINQARHELATANVNQFGLSVNCNSSVLQLGLFSGPMKFQSYRFEAAIAAMLKATDFVRSHAAASRV